MTVATLKPVRMPNGVEVTKQDLCTARWGDRVCRQQFTRVALSADGDYDAVVRDPASVIWSPEYCAHCQRSILRQEVSTTTRRPVPRS